MTDRAPDLLEVSGLTAPQIGEQARALGSALHELPPQPASLEEAFMEMTRDQVEYHAHQTGDVDVDVDDTTGSLA